MTAQNFQSGVSGVEARIELVARYAEMRREAGQDAERLEAARQWALDNGLKYVCGGCSKPQGIITRAPYVDYDALAEFMKTERTKAEIFSFTGQRNDGGKMFNLRSRLEARGYKFFSRAPHGEKRGKFYWVERESGEQASGNQVSGE